MAETDPAGFVRALRGALLEAAELAHGLEGSATNAPKAGETTAEKQALTLADLAAQEIILASLVASYPEVSLEAEEATPSCDRFSSDSDDVVVIDPIDGTLHSYLRGEGPYGILLGLVVRGIYRAGLVALPREGLFFSAAAGAGASWNRAGGPEREARVRAEGNRVLASHLMPEAVCAQFEAQGFDVVFGCGGAVAVAPLIPGIRAGARYAPGERGVSPRGRIGALISREAGAFVTRADGQAFPNDIDTPSNTLLVTASNEDTAALGAAFEAAGCR